MIQDFLEGYGTALALTEGERRLVRDLAVTSPEGLHSLLLTANLPLSHGEAIAPARREDLLEQLWPLLPTRYRACLASPGVADRAARGALPPCAEEAAVTPRREAPPDWPGQAGPRSLAGEAPETRLLEAALAADWPPRDQGNTPTCVAFAACAALEAAGWPAWGWPAWGERLSATFLYNRMRARGSAAAGAERGATKLGDAKAVLEAEGIATEREWPDDSHPRETPGDTARSRAAERRLSGLGYWDRADHGWMGAARAVLTLLRQGRPVAVSLPEYMHPKHGEAVTNWRLPAARLRGEVPNPPPRWKMAPTGHAVCILAFQPAADETLGGWFIFRNSLGLRFATDAPDPGRLGADGAVRAPFVPDNGYGAISAAHVEGSLWEIFAPGGKA